MQMSRLISHSPKSPSYGSFSTAVDLAAIAARVVEEFRDQKPQPDSHADDFEFAFDCDHRLSVPLATADEIFCNGQIRPLNPYALLSCSAVVDSSSTDAKAEDGSTPQPIIRRRRPPLRKLMREERDSAPTSSDADEDLEGVSPETYCVWTPKQQTDGDSSEERHNNEPSSSESQGETKSSNGGNSKRWKLRSLLYARSTSDGKEKYVIVTPVKKNEKKTDDEGKPTAVTGKSKDMVGILKNVNGLSRHLRPF